MHLEIAPDGRAGAETLAIMGEAPRYNAWQYSRISPYLGRRVCEIGAGVGNMSAFLVARESELTVLTDREPEYLASLRRTFGTRSNVVVEGLELPDPTACDRFALYRLDTVVALNVIEHIPEDLAALRTAASLLTPGGRLIALVPALQALYGSLDQALGHTRRYTKASIEAGMRQAGLAVERTFYFNLVGILGWWLNSRVRRARLIPLRQLRLFDSLIPVLRLEDNIPLPLGQSVICVARRPG